MNFVVLHRRRLPAPSESLQKQRENNTEYADCPGKNSLGWRSDDARLGHNGTCGEYRSRHGDGGSREGKD